MEGCMILLMNQYKRRKSHLAKKWWDHLEWPQNTARLRAALDATSMVAHTPSPHLGDGTENSNTGRQSSAPVNLEMPTGVAHSLVSAGNCNTDLTQIPPRSRGAQPGDEVEVSASRRGQLLTLWTSSASSKPIYAIPALTWHIWCQALLKHQTQVVTPVREVEQGPSWL